MTDSTGNNKGFGIQPGGSSAGHYSYDAEGNLTIDAYKAIVLTYNIYNKTDSINFTAATGKYVKYIYGANGEVLRKIAIDSAVTTTTDYIDGFVYINNTLSYFTMPEGRVLNVSGTLTAEYVISDQQGNARITFNNTATGNTAKVIQENSYYGFGMVMPGSTVATPTPQNKNLYNGGSEWQNDYSNNMPGYYETFYRNYDATIGRFIAIDPKAESAESMTPFQYASNNPIMGNDPMGDLLRMLDETPPPPTADKPAVSGANDWLDNTGPNEGEGNGGGGGDSESSLPDGRAQQVNPLADMAAWEADNTFANAWSQEGQLIYMAANTHSDGFGNINKVMNILYNNAHAYGQALLNSIYSGLNYQPATPYVGGDTGGLAIKGGNNPNGYGGDDAGDVHIGGNGYTLPTVSNVVQYGGMCFFQNMSNIASFFNVNLPNFKTAYAYAQSILGSNATQNQLYQFATQSGLNSNDFGKVLSQYFNGGYISNTFSSMTYQINNNHPIAAFLDEGNKVGHAVMITGYSTTSLSLNYYDPQLGGYRNANVLEFHSPYVITGVK